MIVLMENTMRILNMRWNNPKSWWGRQHFRPSVDSDAGAWALFKVELLKTYRILMNNEKDVRADGDDIDRSC